MTKKLFIPVSILIKKCQFFFFDQLKIPEPDYNLGISGGDHGEQTRKMLIKLEEVLNEEKPDFVLVLGDTNSTLAGSLSAVKLGIKTIHIEAGLRSFNREMPEEINRIVSDHTSDYLFAPTSIAIGNLKNEGLIKKTYLTGDIMVDSLSDNIKTAQLDSSIFEKLNVNYFDYYLLTLHRPYNVDSPVILSNILKSLSKLDAIIVFPAHPRTKKIIEENQLKVPKNILQIDPVGYLEFIMLEVNSKKLSQTRAEFRKKHIS
jgi:UDP-N-acetylglucosamine 2-epimerase